MRRLLRNVVGVIAVTVAATLTWANWPYSALPAGASADKIVVWKSKRQMELYSNGKLLRRYCISLGGSPIGRKHQEGDQRTPEGRYSVELHNPQSSYHLSLRVSYPSEADKEAARKQNVPPGGDIMIHGLPNGYGYIGRLQRYRDWTLGCIAVTNPEMDEIYRMVADGTSIDINP